MKGWPPLPPEGPSRFFYPPPHPVPIEVGAAFILSVFDAKRVAENRQAREAKS